MGIISSFLVFIVLLSCINSGLQANYCTTVTYTTINDPRRSTAYTKTSVLCDKNLIRDNDWYRFASEAGGEIPTITPKFGSCGTYAAIWMKGSHPSVEEGTVNRTACANVGSPDCTYLHTIKVRNCSGFYIYQLKRPRDCHSAYCAGSILINCSNTDSGEYCLGNRPPYISIPKRLFACEKSEFQFFFNATDPEGYLLKYDFHPNTTIGVDNIIIDQTQKIVTISRANSSKIVLRVRDSAGQPHIIRTHTIEIVAVPCSCQNGGTYKSNITVSTKREDVSNYTCICVKPYTGQFCEISPCDLFPCFPGVNCTATTNGYKCEKCPSRFEGDGKTCKLLTKEDTVVVEGEFSIISGLKWQPDLANNTSFIYKQQTAKIVTEIMAIYRNIQEFVHVIITGYSKGNVVVKFQLVFKKKMNDPLKILKAHLTDNKGTLGSFNIDPNSLKEKVTPGSEKEDLYLGLHKTVFIVVTCVVSVLALTAMVVCAICIKKKHISIIILSMNENRRQIVPSSSNTTSQRKKPSHNQVMDLHSVATSTGVC